MICRRGTSRFGQVNFWLDGQPAVAGARPNLEKADMFILVGYPLQLRLRAAELDSYINRSSTITVAITAETLDEVPTRQAKGLDLPILIDLRPDFSDAAALVLDSLVALHHYYENALSRFSLFDLRYLWPDGTQLEVSRYHWGRQLADADEPSAAALTRRTLDPLSPRLLAVLRGPNVWTEEELAKMLTTLPASPPARKAPFWYAVGQPPSTDPVFEALLFSPAEKENQR